MAGRLHGAGEEAAVEQVQDRVLDAADVLVDRQPAIDHLAVGRRVLDPRISEAREVPRRIDEGVHRVGLARGRPVAAWARDVLPGRMAVERIARLVEVDDRGQLHRQVLHRHRHDAAFLAVDDRDRASPIALARDAPVAQAKIHLALADRPVAARLALEPARHLLLGLLDRHAVEEARIDHPPVAIIGGVGDDEGLGIDVGRAHHRRVAEPVFVDEVEIALVVRRAAEDRAGSVVHQDEVRHVDRQLPVRVERMDRLHPGVEAELFRLVDQLLRGAGAPALGDEGGERGILLRGGSRERMIGRQRHEFCAEQRVRPRGVDFELGLAARRRLRIEREADQQALRAADPVLLHDAHFFRPAVERVERAEQLVREGGDPEEPLGELALFDRRAGAPAAAVDHLFVGEHGLVDRVPVDPRLLAFDQPRREEVEEHALLVLVVARIAGRDLAAPVEREAHRLELRLHRFDVLVGPRARIDLALDGGVLGRQAERVPSHRMQHVEASGALVARHHVAHRVVAHVPHVDAPGRVGEHLQHVVFRARIGVGGGEDAALVPDFLPAGLRLAGVVTLGAHGGGLRPDCGERVNGERCL